MKKMEKRLGFGSVVAISIATMLGSGIFVLPGIAFATTGPSMWLAYLLAGLCVLPAAASKSELATAMPTSGGTYVYIERTFGPMAGTIAGLGLWISLLLKSAFALVGFGAYLSVFTTMNVQYLSLAILLFVALLNIFGVGKVSALLIVIVSICLVSLALLSGSALFHLDLAALSPFMFQGFEGLAAATALVFVSFTGVTKVAAVAEEIKEPERNLPRGIFTSIVVVTTLYCAISFVLACVIPAEQLTNNLKPIYHLAKIVVGDFWAAAVAIIAILTTSSMSNAGLMAAARFPFAMSRDKLLPSAIGRLQRRFLTPVWSIIASAAFIALAVVFIDVGRIAKLASAFMLMIYMIENVAVIVLRESRVQWYKPTYLSPLYPLTQVFGLVTCLSLLFSMDIIVLPTVLSISVPGVLLYFFYSRKRTTRKGVIGIRGKRQDLVEDIMPPSRRSHMKVMEDIAQKASGAVILFGKESSPEMLIEMGAALTPNGNLEIAHITEVPEQTDLDDIIEEPAELRSLRRRVVAMAMEKKRAIIFDPIVSHDIYKTIYHISQRLHCEWLLIEWHGRAAGLLTFHDPVGWLKEHLHCNLCIFKCMGVRYIRKIMVFLKGNESDDIVVKTADQLAEVNHADITLVSYLSTNSQKSLREQAKRNLGRKAAQCASGASTSLLIGDKIAPTILEATVSYDLMVFGLSQYSFASSLLGTLDDTFMAKASCSVISVQADTAPKT